VNTFRFSTFPLFHLILIFGLTLSFSPAAAQSGKPVPVGVARAVTLAPSSTIKLPGTVFPWASTRLAAEVDGRVDTLLFNEGQYVKKGTLLVQLRTQPFELQRNLAAAEKQKVATRLQELKSGTRQETLDAAQASLEHAAARLKLTENELKRVTKLFRDGVLSLNEFDNAKAEADEARAVFEEKKAIQKELQAGPRIEKILQEEANLQAAEARIRIIDDDISRASLYAPFNGFIVKKETEIGQWLEKGDPAVSMIAVEPMKVEVDVPQSHFHKITLGTRGKIILESGQPDVPSQEFSGTVIEKIFSGDPNSRTFPVRLKIRRTRARLVSGMLVQVELYPNGNKNNKLFVPKDAIVRKPRQNVVWVIRVNKDKSLKAVGIPVETGEPVDNLVAVHSAGGQIKAGDRVVIHGNERLRPNASVVIINKKF